MMTKEQRQQHHYVQDQDGKDDDDVGVVTTTRTTTIIEQQQSTSTSTTKTETHQAAEAPSSLLSPNTTTSTTSTTTTPNNNIFKGTLVTLGLKMISFIFQQFTLRVLDPTTLGKATIQLELLLSTILFISREGFRLSLTKKTKTNNTENDNNHNNIRNWNVAWLTIPLVTIVSGCTLIWHILTITSTRSYQNNDINNEEKEDYDYYIAGILYCISSWMEGCGEPAVLYFLKNFDVPKRASAETFASIMKTISIVLTLKFIIIIKNNSNNNESSYYYYYGPVTAFGISQLIYATTYSGYLYYQAFKTQHFKGPDFQTITKPYFDVPTIQLTTIFTIQGFFKHLLTEGDKIVLTAVSSNYNQGVYAMGAAYGGMAARLLLQPLEENARLLWSRLATTTTTTTTTSSATSKESSSSLQQHQQQQQLKQSYTSLVKMVLYLGFVFSCIAVNYTNLLLCILAGRKWGQNEEAAIVLSAFCIYTAFLALNGMTEAFVYAVTTSGRDVTRLGIVHTLTGIIFAFVGPYLVTHHGTVGLVLANCIAMSLRSFYSIYFASQYFGGDESMISIIRQIVPHPVVLGSFAFSYIATRWSFQQIANEKLHQTLDIRNPQWQYLNGQHIAIGISSVIGILTMIYIFEGPFLRSLKSMMRSRRGTCQEKNEKQD